VLLRLVGFAIDCAAPDSTVRNVEDERMSRATEAALLLLGEDYADYRAL